jgi:hypothetical protein
LIVYAYPVNLAGATVDQIVLAIGSLDPDQLTGFDKE